MSGLRDKLRAMCRPPTLVWVWLLLVVVGTAAAQSLGLRTTGVSWDEGVPRLSVSAADLANARVRRELSDGLQKRIVLTIQAFRMAGSSPIVTQTRQCLVTYDLWEEAYIVRRGRRTELARDIDGVLRRCLILNRHRLGTPEAWARHRGQDVFFAIRAEFNPISRRRCRQLLRPTGGDDPIGPIVVNIVRREICRAERAIDFRSGAVRVP